MLEFIHAPQCNICEKEVSIRIGARSEAVIGRLGDHVGKVDAFSEHVSGRGCFRGSNAQACSKNACVVRHAGAVPQQLAIAKRLAFLKPLRLSRTLDVESLFNFKRVLVVSLCVCVLHIFVDHLEEIRVAINDTNIRVELSVVDIEGVFLLRLGLHFQHLGGDLDLRERVEHARLVLQSLAAVNQWNLHSRLEFVRNKRVKAVGCVYDAGAASGNRQIDRDVRCRVDVDPQVRLKFGEHRVRRPYLRRTELPEGHFLEINLKFKHCALDGVDVEKSPDEALHRRVELAAAAEQCGRVHRGTARPVVVSNFDGIKLPGNLAP
eukprot:Opistho-2@89478